MYRPEGVFVAMATPMDGDERIRLDEVERQVRRFELAGADALFPLGTNGEFFALEYGEKIEVLAAVMESASRETVKCAGVGCVTTRETVALAREAEAMGVDAVAVITPYFAALSQDQLYRHFTAVADSVSIPVILYNIPQRTGNSIDFETAARLAAVENIAGIKDSSGKLENLRGYLETVPDGFAVLVGSDGLILEGLRAGAAGCVSGMANATPELVVAICRCWKAGDEAGAESAQARLSNVRRILGLGNPNSIVKQAANLLGQPLGPCRSPGRIPDGTLDRPIAEILSECGYTVPGSQAEGG